MFKRNKATRTFNLPDHLIKVLGLQGQPVLNITVHVSHDDRPQVTITRYLTQAEADQLGHSVSKDYTIETN